MSDEIKAEEPLRGLCACCGYPNVPTRWFGQYEPELYELCRLCAATLAGNSMRHPDLYPNADVLKATCFVGNALLDQMGAFREWQADHEHIRDEDL